LQTIAADHVTVEMVADIPITGNGKSGENQENFENAAVEAKGLEDFSLDGEQGFPWVWLRASNQKIRS